MIYLKDGASIPFDAIPQHSVMDADGTITVSEKNVIIVNDNIYVPRMLLGQCYPAVGQAVRMRIVPNLGLKASLELHKCPWKAVEAYLC